MDVVVVVMGVVVEEDVVVEDMVVVVLVVVLVDVDGDWLDAFITATRASGFTSATLIVGNSPFFGVGGFFL